MELMKVYQESTGWSDALCVLGFIAAIVGVIWIVCWITDSYCGISKRLLIPTAMIVIGICMVIGSNYIPQRTLEQYQVTNQSEYKIMLDSGYHEYASDELTVTVYRDDN